MWYYEWNQQPFGPVSVQTITEAMKSGKINASTLVWREGMTEWKKLAETQLSVLTGVSQTMPGENIALSAPSRYMEVPHYPRVRSDTLKKLFWWWFGLTVASIPYSLLNYILPDQSWMNSLLCIFSISLLAGDVLQYILLYKFWQIIQDGFARTTPGKAVGFLFIPIYSFYWIFVAYYGLAKDLNGYADRHFGSNPNITIRKTIPGVQLAFIIYSLVQVILAGYMFIRMMASALAALGNIMQTTSFMAPFNLPLMILSIISILFMLFVYWQLNRTAGDILLAEEKS